MKAVVRDHLAIMIGYKEFRDLLRLCPPLDDDETQAYAEGTGGAPTVITAGRRLRVDFVHKWNSFPFNVDDTGKMLVDEIGNTVPGPLFNNRLAQASIAGSPVSSLACFRNGMSAVPPVPRSFLRDRDSRRSIPPFVPVPPPELAAARFIRFS